MSVSFAGHELHSPRFGLEEARELARELFAVEGAASELGSHQDQNVLIAGPSGRFVLKIANAAFGEAELDLQNRAMVHLAERLPIEVPQPCPARDGREIVAVERDGVTYLLRLVTFIEGEPLIDAPHLAPPVLRALGEVAGARGARARGLRAPGGRPRHAMGPTPRRRRRRGARPARRGCAPPRSRERGRGSCGRGHRAARAAAAPAGCSLRRDRLERDRPPRPSRPADALRRDRLRRRDAHAARVRARGRGLDRLRPRAGRPDLRSRRDRPGVRRRLPTGRRRAGGAAAPDRRARCDRRRRHRAAGGARAAQRLRPARARGGLGDLRDGRRAARAARRRAFCGGPAAAVSPRSPRACPAARGRFRASSPARSSISRRPASIRSRRPAPSEPMPRRAGTRRASSRTTSRRRSTSASTSSRPRAARCARRSQVAWNTRASASSCSRPAAQRCAWRVSCPPWRWATASRPEPSSGASEQGRELPPHLHVQVGPSGLDAARAGDAGSRGGVARALPASRRAARPRGGRSAGARPCSRAAVP